jgi:hypothetical protein
MKRHVLWFCFIGAGLTLSLPLFANEEMSVQEPLSPRGKTYDIWVSQSFAPPPFTPFHDCLTVSATGNAMTLAQLGPSAFASVPDGLTGKFEGFFGFGLNLLFKGQHLNGTDLGLQANTIGGTIAGTAQGTSFGFQGIENPGCTLSPADLAQGNPYGSSPK